MKRKLLFLTGLLMLNIGWITAQTLSPFNLLAPATNTVVNVNGSPTTNTTLRWTHSSLSGSSGNVSYTWLLDLPGGNFSSPLLAIPSNQQGNDSILVMNNAQIEAYMIALNMNVGDSVDVIWTVRASAAGISLLASQNFNIRLKRGTLNHPGLQTFSPIGIGGGSANGRAPATQFTYNRSSNVYPAADMAHIPAGTEIKSLGFTITTAAANAVSGNIKLYLVNTNDTSYARSTSWATLLTTPSPMKKVYDGPLTIPNVAGTYTITFDSVFTFTGGGIYVAFEWQQSGTVTGSATYQCNTEVTGANRTGTSNTSMPASVSTSSNFRPRIALGYDRLSNDLEVRQLYSLAKLPIPVANPHTVQANILNNSATPLINRKVYLNITGANTFVDSQVVTLGVNQETTLNFSAFNPANLGQNTLSVSVATDDNNGNNLRVITQEVNENTFSYADSTEMTNSVGFGAAVNGIFANRYNVNGTVTIKKMRARIGNNAATVGNRVYGVLIDSDNNVIGKSPYLIVGNADLGQYIEWTFDFPLVVTNDFFYVGFVQTAAFNGTQYFPLMFQDEAQFRSGAYYSTTDTTGLNLAPNTGGRRFILEAIFEADVLNAFSLTAPANNASITLQGNQSQTVDFSWSPSTLPSGNPVQYSLLFDLPNGDFSNPVMTIPSTFTTSISLNYGSIVDSLAARGITVGSTFTGKWTVRAEGSNNSRLADAAHNISFIRDIMTSVEEEKLAAIKVYPNPSTGLVVLDASFANADEIEVKVINSVGQVVYNSFMTYGVDDNKQLDFSSFNNGIYFIHLSTGNAMAIKRLVIQK